MEVREKELAHVIYSVLDPYDVSAFFTEKATEPQDQGKGGSGTMVSHFCVVTVHDLWNKPIFPVKLRLRSCWRG